MDYRRLNEVTRKDSYPLPHSDDTIEALAGSEWFSILDLKSSYWQVEMDDGDKEKTAFLIGSGLCTIHCHAIRTMQCPATFECLMEQVLSGLPLSIALVYLDDVLVSARTLLIKFLISNKFFGGSGRCI